MDNKSFAVKLGKGNAGRIYKQALIDTINKKYPYLSMAGLDAPFYTNSGREIRSIEYAGSNNYLTFGTSKTHDVNWSNNSYSEYPGYVPAFDIIKDWSRIVNKLDAFAQAKKAKNSYSNTYYQHSTGDVVYVGGQKVEIYDAFIKIGLHIISRNINRLNYRLLSPIQLNVIREISIEYIY